MTGCDWKKKSQDRRRCAGSVATFQWDRVLHAEDPKNPSGSIGSPENLRAIKQTPHAETSNLIRPEKMHYFTCINTKHIKSKNVQTEVSQQSRHGD